MRIIMLICLLLVSYTSSAERLIAPPGYVMKYSKELAYKDFPRQIDILSIIRVESAFNPNAFNPENSKINPTRKVPPSKGLMQVQNGTFRPKNNMIQGTSILREYYLKYCNRDIKCAIKSYNIGPGNYRKGKLKKSGNIYFSKYKHYKKQYTIYLNQLTK